MGELASHPEERVVGRYALLGELASGGMATVHFGRLIGPVGFSRTVAIKRLHAQFAKDPEFVAMFLDEARLAARIQHPNVVSTLDVVALEGELLLVLEYIHGEALAQLLRTARKAKQPLPLKIVAAIASGMLHGLHAAHEAKSEHGEPLGIVHRDMSPQNVLVGVDGTARVLDFGVAKAVGRVVSTREGQLKGKLAYMSPEQVHGGAVDRRTDIYAASIVVWEVLTGRRLFDGDNEGLLFSQVSKGATKHPSEVVPDLPPDLDAIVMRGLAREPRTAIPPPGTWPSRSKRPLAWPRPARWASGSPPPPEIGWRSAPAASRRSRAYPPSISSPSARPPAARRAATAPSSSPRRARAPAPRCLSPPRRVCPSHPLKASSRAWLSRRPAARARVWQPRSHPGASQPGLERGSPAALHRLAVFAQARVAHGRRRDGGPGAAHRPRHVAPEWQSRRRRRRRRYGTIGGPLDSAFPAGSRFGGLAAAASARGLRGDHRSSGGELGAGAGGRDGAHRAQARGGAGGRLLSSVHDQRGRDPQAQAAVSLRMRVMDRTVRTWLAGALALSVLSLSGGASAAKPEGLKQQCVEAYEQTQSLRKSASLRSARASALTCAQAGCPAVVKKDCAAWLTELDQSLPSVVLSARDKAGQETTAVRVFVDNEPLVERLDGRAVALDPGAHTFRF